MMDPFRLDSVAPVVAERFRQATSNKRREAARVACEVAVVAAGLEETEVSEALAVLRGCATPNVLLRERLDRLAARFDDECFELAEDDDQKQQALLRFSKARATSALAFALAADDTQLHEAIYESISALGEPAEMVHKIEEVLG
jgi:ethanolamine utilization protein EutA (predicted chaperonin)